MMLLRGVVGELVLLSWEYTEMCSWKREALTGIFPISDF
jgi:hypothetical protein